MNGDGNTVLTLLMRYPVLSDITPILDIADMVRRSNHKIDACLIYSIYYSIFRIEVF